MFKLLNKFFEENKFAKIILKHDGIIYGNIVRDLVTNKLNLNKDYVIKAFIPNKYKKIIERSLYNTISKIVNYNETIKSSYLSEYVLKKNKHNVSNLFIYYLPEIYLYDNNSLLKEPNKYILLDINGLGISRKGIELLFNNKSEIPLPFYDIIKNINNKEFSIINKIKSEKEFKYVQSFINKGWVNKESKINIYKGSSFKSDICNICRDAIAIEDEVCLLSDCNHYFHKDCWIENINQCIKNQYNSSISSLSFDKLTINCPICRKEYDVNHMI